MKQYDIGIIISHIDLRLNGSFAIIIEDYLDDYFLVEIWNFDLFDGAKVDSLHKKKLRLATEDEVKKYKFKFSEYCNKNNSSNISKMKGLSHEFSLLDSRLESFVSDLKINGYSNFEYFENIREDIKKGKKGALEQLKSSFAITQYANFSKDLEDKLSDIISLC